MGFGGFGEDFAGFSLFFFVFLYFSLNYAGFVFCMWRREEKWDDWWDREDE